MSVEHTKEYTRESVSKALLANDVKALEQYKKQKAVALMLKEFKAAQDRINKLEEVVQNLEAQIKQLQNAGNKHD